MKQPAIVLDKITKRFPGVVALNEVSLVLQGGLIHALVGENGAGKSTLTQVVGGVLYPDGGSLEIEGEAVAKMTPQALQTHYSVALVPQELQLCNELSAAENIWVGHEPVIAPGFPSRRKMLSKTRALYEELGLDTDVERSVKKLPVGLRQMTVIARAIARNARVLLLDEPTSVLDNEDVARLFGQLRRLKRSGVTILYVSHRLPEVFELADHIHVLRDGSVVSSSATRDTSEKTIVADMVGRELLQTRREGKPVGDHDSRTPALSAEGLCGPGVQAVTLQVAKGEVLGIAGLPGSGRTELLELIFDGSRSASGVVEVNGKRARIRSPRDAIKLGIGFLPGERKAQGIVGGLSVAANMALIDLQSLSRFGMVRYKKVESDAREGIKQFDVRCRSSQQPVKFLSGGNQQKVLLARVLRTNPSILLLDEPTRGIDVGTKAEIYRILRKLAAADVAIIVSSSDLPELLSECDRIAVMADGELQTVLHHSVATEELIVEHAIISSGREMTGSVTPQ